MLRRQVSPEGVEVTMARRNKLRRNVEVIEIEQPRAETDGGGDDAAPAEAAKD